MANLRTIFRQAGMRRLASQHTVTVIVALLFAIAGILALLAVRADTASITAEAEDGVIAGNAHKKDAQTGASGDTVSFGASTDPNVPLPFPSKTGPFSNPMSNLCLDVQDGVASPSTPIRIWSCNGAPAQTWTVQFTKNGASEIRALDKCLTGTVPSTLSYTNVFLDTCDGRLEQLWLPRNNGTRVISFKSTTFGTDDYCLDVSNSNPAAGTRVGLWRCLDNPAQRWSRPAGAPFGNVFDNPYDANPDKCIDLPSGNTTPGTQLQVWDCNLELAQYIVNGYDDPPGTRMRISVLNQCFEARDGGTADGTAVQINTCSNSPAQDWLFVKWGGGPYGYKHRVSGKCIDTDSGEVANSARLVLRTCDADAPGQRIGGLNAVEGEEASDAVSNESTQRSNRR
jgi:hypothetical protein